MISQGAYPMTVYNLEEDRSFIESNVRHNSESLLQNTLTGICSLILSRDDYIFTRIVLSNHTS